ncbi:MAG: hypothetical protein ACYDD1_03940 [Caulobacteraceae bacterium]
MPDMTRFWDTHNKKDGRMADPRTSQPKVSNRLSPIAIVIAVALMAMVAIALLKTAGHHVTPTGVKAPMAAAPATVMPQQSSVPDAPQPMANTNDASELQHPNGISNTAR